VVRKIVLHTRWFFEAGLGAFPEVHPAYPMAAIEWDRTPSVRPSHRFEGVP